MNPWPMLLQTFTAGMFFSSIIDDAIFWAATGHSKLGIIIAQSIALIVLIISVLRDQKYVERPH